jgi:hypothetical protein
MNTPVPTNTAPPAPTALLESTMDQLAHHADVLASQVEELACIIATMNRERLVSGLKANGAGTTNKAALAMLFSLQKVGLSSRLFADEAFKRLEEIEKAMKCN